jgi:hypothetical protein
MGTGHAVAKLDRRTFQKLPSRAPVIGGMYMTCIRYADALHKPLPQRGPANLRKSGQQCTPNSVPFNGPRLQAVSNVLIVLFQPSHHLVCKSHVQRDRRPESSLRSLRVA